MGIPTHLLLVTMLAVFAASTVFSLNVAWAKTGSYTISFTGTASPEAQIRVTAKAEDGTEYDETFDIQGLNQTQARDLIRTDLAGAGWSVQDNGTNGIIITGHGGSDIKQVDIGDNRLVINTSGDGNVTISEARPGDKKFKFLAALPNADRANPGTLVLTLNENRVAAQLAPGDTPEQAAAKLNKILADGGFVTTLAGPEITLDWEEPTNLELIGPEAKIDFGVIDGAGGPHLAIGLPDSVEEAIVFDGLPNRPLGTATLEVVGGKLAVSNIGSSGQDGVTIGVGDAPNGFNVLLDPVDLSRVGTAINVAAVGTLSGVPGSPFGTAGCQNVGGTVQAIANFSAIGSSNVRIEVYNAGRLVGSTTVAGGGVVATVTGGPRITGCGKLPPFPPRWPFPCFIINLDRPGTFTATNNNVLVGNQVRLLAADATKRVESLSGFDVTGTSLGQFNITREIIVEPPVVFDGLPNRPLGNAKLSLLRGSLLVSNIGSSGEDGVAIDVGDAPNGFNVALTPVNLSRVGTSITASAVGTVGGVPGRFLGFGGCRNNAGTVQAFADYSAIGSKEVKIEIYNNGTLVGEAVVAGGGVVGTVTGGPQIIGCGKLPPIPLPCIIVDLDRIATFTPVNGTALQGNQVRLLAANPTGRIDSVSGFDITGADLGRFAITKETVGEQPGSVVFDGLVNRARGAAQLDVAGGRLVVSNIGSSGQDGVAIDVGDAPNGFHVSLDPIDLSKVGTAINVEATGTFNNVRRQFLGRAGCQNVGGTVQAVANFSAIGSANVQVEIYNNGRLSGRAIVRGGGVVGVVTGGPRITGCGKLPTLPPRWPFPCIIIDLDRVATFTPTGGQPLQGNEVRLLAASARGEINSLSGFDLIGTDLGRFAITSETILKPPARFDGLANHPLGVATLDVSRGGLVVSNIGSSGEDGVSIDVGDAPNGFDVSLEPVNLGRVGTAINVAASGVFNGVANSFLGTAGCRNNGGVVQAVADYSAIGSANVQVEIYNNGTFVGRSVVSGGGVVGVVTGGPQITGCGKLPTLPPRWPLPCFIIDLDRLATFTPTGGQPFQGNEVRLLAATPTGRIDTLSSFDVTGTNLGKFVITGETILEPQPAVALELWQGINLISVPLEPDPQPWHLSDLARHIGSAVNFIVWYDHRTQRFISYFPDFPEDSPANKRVEGGEGYIAVLSEPVTVTFVGKGWNNTTPPAAPSLHAGGMPVLVIDGLLFSDLTGERLDGAKVTIRNQRTGAVVDDVTGVLGKDGAYTLTFANRNNRSVAEVGDTLILSVLDGDGTAMIEPTAYQLTAETLRTNRLTLEPLWVAPIPKEFALLQNYPNPFNPETWLPYQLAERAFVSIEIYDQRGRVVRTLELGHQPAGTYHSRAKAAYWDGKNALGESVTSGIYFYALKAGSFSEVRKMVILK